jgi:diketogulonate reductase-like aldo/keto reductase
MSQHAQLPVPKFLYGTAWKEQRTASLTELALRTGFRGIDTANQRRHYFEAAVGEALERVYREGFVKREGLFLQTKFTYREGQDHRLPYDPSAGLAEQVSQSMNSSLQHLRTDYVDSYILHGPSSARTWNTADAEVWDAMVTQRARGRTRSVGVSNVSLQHLESMSDVHKEGPQCVQNRCYARLGWDRDVRRFCTGRRIVYQGFSLLTANQEVLHHPFINKIASLLHATPAQVIFCFAIQLGILPLTGTSDITHMGQDLASDSLKLPPETLEEIEYLAG